MNKKLLALAVGAALTVPMTASAGVTWYGQLQAEISSESSTLSATNNDGTIVQTQSGATSYRSRGGDGTFMEDNKRGRLGVKASEKLGNGLTAIAKFEWQVDTTTADSYDGQRESFVGLKGGFGTVTLGANKSPYKYTGGVKYDPFVTTNLEARRYGGMISDGGNNSYSANGFVQSSISYKTPKMNGFSAWVTYVPSESASTYKDTSAALKYKGGNFEAFVAYGKDDSADLTTTKVGGFYKMGMHKFKIQYENLDATVNGNILFLGYEGKFGGHNVLVAQYGRGNRKYTTKQKSDYYALGVIHKLSKKTRLFGGYMSNKVKNPSGASGLTNKHSAFSVGLRQVF